MCAIWCRLQCQILVLGHCNPERDRKQVWVTVSAVFCIKCKNVFNQNVFQPHDLGQSHSLWGEELFL